ncbi:MAG: ABZJ_00895 family protein [Pseudomonadota bacterium]
MGEDFVFLRERGTAMTQNQIRWQFVGVALVAQIAIVIIGFFVPSTTSLGGVSFIVPFLAALFTSGQFLKKESRLPTEEEKKAAVKTQLVAWIVFSIVLAIFSIAAIVPGATGDEQSLLSPLVWGIVAIFLAVVLVLQWLMIRWAWGGQMRKMAKKQGLSDA